MTPEQINIAIAEACGYVRHGEIEFHKDGTKYFYPPVFCEPTFPNYCSDLNAMHEAERVLPEKERSNYCFILSELACVAGDMGWGECHATAAQRSKAFLRTIGKWTATEEGR